MGVESNLVDLISHCHREIREIFLIHQEALLLGDFSQAQVLFNSYRTCHDKHKRFEDETLIPEFATLKRQSKWSPDVYEKEHNKITDWLEKLSNDLDRLTQHNFPVREKRHHILTLLDKEKTFKGLTEHHEEREEEAMLVELDKQTDIDWREQIIKPFNNEWDELLHQEKIIISNILKSWE